MSRKPSERSSEKLNRVEILKASFQRTKTLNPSFSIRSLAQKMKLSPSFISKVFNGKSELPLERVPDLVRFLKMDKLSESRLLKTYIDDKVKKVTQLSSGKKHKDPLKKYQELSDRDFHLLKDWFIIPILDSCGNKDFSVDPESVSKKFSISLQQAQSALSLLIDNGYLLKDSKGQWTKLKRNLRFPTERSRSHIRSYHAQMMKKALECLVSKTEQEHFDKRLINGMSIATNSKNIDRAISRLNEVLYEIGDILSEGECDEVYHLNIQLFPLTHRQ